MSTRPGTWNGLLIGVAGGRGAGSSLLARCLAEDLASDASNRGLVLLADIATAGADQAPSQDRPHMVARAHVRAEDDLEGLMGGYRFVVADIGADISGFVGNEPTGAAEGAPLAMAALSLSDLIVVVGTADTRSLNSLVQTIETLDGLVGADRVLPVVNRLPRGFKRRSAAVFETVRLLASSSAFAAGDPVLITEGDTVQLDARAGPTPPWSLVRPLSSEVRLRLATALRIGGTATTSVPSAFAGD
ncbi:MAG: hypothetical protein F4Z34_11065 [Acidimicrobiaceae bacterium]|nr:hypothetical protein [Acidimicrobiaceae bacterium]